MTLSEERKQELEPLSIRVYRQIGAGYDWEKIKAQFDHIEGTDPEEVAWVLSSGRQRYAGYLKVHEAINKSDATSTLIFGAGVVIIAVAVIAIFGVPDAGRLRGREIALALLGVGIVGYGVWCRIKAKPTGFPELPEAGL